MKSGGKAVLNVAKDESQCLCLKMTNKTHEKWIRPKLYLNCGAGSSGGVMRVTSSSVEISYSTFINNSASNRGGVLELLYDSSLLILHSTFEDNMAIGFDACFYEGMNLYVKTWLQLAFPIYNFILVIFDNPYIFEIFKIFQLLRSLKPCSHPSHSDTALIHQASTCRDYVIFSRFPEISKRHNCSTLVA